VAGLGCDGLGARDQQQPAAINSTTVAAPAGAGSRPCQDSNQGGDAGQQGGAGAEERDGTVARLQGGTVEAMSSRAEVSEQVDVQDSGVAVLGNHDAELQRSER